MNTRIKNLKLKLELSDADTGEVIWTDWVMDDTEQNSGMFTFFIDRAEEILGKMERNLAMILERDYPEDDAEDEDTSPKQDTLKNLRHPSILRIIEDIPAVEGEPESESKEYFNANG
jgi:hypothetical protein